SDLSLDRRDALDLVDEIRASSGERKALVAFELSRLESYELTPVQRGRFLEGVERILQDSEDGDPRVRRSLTLTLGRLADRTAVPALLKAAEDPDPETQIYALWALGAIRDSSARSALEAHLHHEDAGIRKTAAFALGQLGDVLAAPSLRVALQDSVPDVTWNAPLAPGTPRGRCLHPHSAASPQRRFPRRGAHARPEGGPAHQRDPLGARASPGR